MNQLVNKKNDTSYMIPVTIFLILFGYTKILSLITLIYTIYNANELNMISLLNILLYYMFGSRIVFLSNLIATCYFICYYKETIIQYYKLFKGLLKFHQTNNNNSDKNDDKNDDRILMLLEKCINLIDELNVKRGNFTNKIKSIKENKVVKWIDIIIREVSSCVHEIMQYISSNIYQIYFKKHYEKYFSEYNKNTENETITPNTTNENVMKPPSNEELQMMIEFMNQMNQMNQQLSTSLNSSPLNSPLFNLPNSNLISLPTIKIKGKKNKNKKKKRMTIIK